MPLFSLRPAATLWPPVLLGSQFVFNIGFYAVVPFLALFLRDDMLLSGGLIGLILGLRTFSQQGMFILGGRWPTAMALRRSFSPAASFASPVFSCWRAGRRCGPLSSAPA